MNRPNILIVITHDSGQHFGCYGDAVATPNIDRVAADGVRFANNFCTAPQCSPARASLLTGLYPHRHGLIGLTHRGWRLDGAVRRLPAMLGEAGYHPILFGFHHEEPDPHQMGYHRWVRADTVKAASVTPKVLEWLASHPAEPFFACVGFFETHRKFSGRIVDDPRAVKVPGYLPDDPIVRDDIAQLYGEIRTVDECVGRIDAALHEAGLARNTLLIYTTDHGIAFPHAKATLHDAGLAVAMVGRGPASTGFVGGKVVEAMTSTMDLTPTLLGLGVAGADVPADLDGADLRPLLADPAAPWRDHLFGEQTYHAGYDPMRSIRTERFRYIRCWEDRPICFAPNTDASPSRALAFRMNLHRTQRPMEMLYDMQADPFEQHNLANDPQFADTLAELRGRLQRWMEATDDPLLAGHVPAPEGAQFCPAGVLSPNQFEGVDDWRQAPPSE